MDPVKLFSARTVWIQLILLAVPAALRADTIYSNFGPGDSFNTDGGHFVSSSTNARPSFSFSTTSSEVLSQVDFVTSIGAVNDLNQVTVSVSDDAGGHPGTVLDSRTFNNAMGFLGGVNGALPGILSWQPSISVALVAGVTYWITLDGPVPGDVTWNYNNQHQFGYSEYNPSSGWQATSNTLGAIRIIGTAGTQDPGSPGPGNTDPTPEPQSALLLTLGAGAFLALKSQSRLTSKPR